MQGNVDVLTCPDLILLPRTRRCIKLSVGAVLLVRVRYRKGFEKQELMHPGEVYAIQIVLLPTSNCIQGQRSDSGRRF